MGTRSGGRTRLPDRGSVGSTGASVLLLLTVSFGAGCNTHSHWEGVRRELQRLAAEERTVSPSGDLLDLRGAIHVHSHLSHDSDGRAEEIRSAARRADLDFLVITDHEGPGAGAPVLGAGDDALLVILGMEVNRGCFHLADRCPSLLAIGLKRRFPSDEMGWQEVIHEIQAQGGLAFVAHPRGWPDWSLEGLTGMEIYDLLDDVLDEKHRLPGVFLDVLHSYDAYPKEVLLSLLDRPRWHLRKWDEVGRGRRMVGIAGNDAHRNVKVWGRQVDPYELSLRFVTTHVWARSLDEPSVLAALSRGHAYVAFELLADAEGFRFEAPERLPPALAGDEVPLGGGLKLVARTPLRARISLLRDGTSFRECECQELSVTVTQPGRYRVEASLRMEDAWWPWILANPIAVGGSTSVLKQ